RREEMNALRSDVRSELAERLNVVEHPESASVCGNDESVVVYEQVVNRHDRQLLLQRLPVRAVIERGVDSALGASEEQAALFVVRTDDAREFIVRNTINNFRPCFSVIDRFVQVRMEIV